MIEDYFDPEEGILHVTSRGDIKIEEFTNGIKKLNDGRDLPKKLKILEDAREANVKFNIKELIGLVSGLGKSFQSFDKVRHAVIHTRPKNTAMAILASNLKKTDKYELKVFSTPEAAKSWLIG